MNVDTGHQRADEAEQGARLRAQAFQHSLGPYYDPDQPAPDLDRVHVARAGTTVVGTVTVFPFGQWFGGRSVPMGGVAGVAVAPEARGHGIARRLMTEAIAAMYERGEIISSLYPTTSTLYRSMGYEFAGRWERTNVPLHELASVSAGRSAKRSGLTVTALAAGQLQRMRPLYDSLAAESNGWLDRSDLLWDRMDFSLNPQKSNSFGYIITDADGEVVAGLTVSHKRRAGPYKFDLDVGGPYASNADGFIAALHLIAAWETTAESATLNLPVEQLAAHLPEAILDHADSWLWMLRLVDVEKALAARGYQRGVATRFDFDLTDDVAPWNSGGWSVTIENGLATVTRAEAAPPNSDGSPSRLSVDIQTLSCLFTGLIAPIDLGRSGRLPGADPETIDALTLAFQGHPPRIVDFF